MNSKETEISFVDFILNIWVTIKFLKTKWLYLISIPLIVGALSYFYFKNSKNIYKASSTFYIEDNKANNYSQAIALVSQFGISTGNENGISNKDLIGIVNSRKLIKTAMLAKVGDNSNSRIGNLILNRNLENVNFNFKALNVYELNSSEDSLLNTLYDLAVKQIISIKENQESGFINLEIATQSRPLSLLLNSKIIDLLNNYFSESFVSDNNLNFAKTKYKLDSISQILKYKESIYAKDQDRSSNIIKKQGKTDQINLQREIALLNKMYTEAVNLNELAKIKLTNRANLFHIVDEPVYSIEIIKPKTIFKSLVLTIISFFLLIFYFLTIHYLKGVFSKKF
jgi:hypothetical protein